MPLDTIGFGAVQALTGHPVVDTAMVVAAEMLILLVPATLVLLWFRDAGRIDTLYVFAVTITALTISYLLGFLFGHPAPYEVAAYSTIAAGAPENAFPSQHAVVVLAAALGAYWRDRPTLGHTLLAAGFVTGFARVYIGEHYPVDVAGSLLAAGLGLALVAATQDRTRPLVSSTARLGARIETRIRDRLP